jgi:hypothetical protein
MGMVAVRPADLASSVKRRLGTDGHTALVAAGAGQIKDGCVVFLRPVAVAG